MSYHSDDLFVTASATEISLLLDLPMSSRMELYWSHRGLSSGEINFFSAQLFNMSLILTGSVFAFFYIHVIKIFSGDNQGIFAFIGSLSGVLGGLCLVGVGLTPADLYLDIHIIFATWLFHFFFVASLCYTIVIFRHAQFENKFAGGYLVFTISIFFLDAMQSFWVVSEKKKSWLYF